MRRSFDVTCPTVRSAFGRSFGPMTMRATPPISITSPQLMSSMSSTVLLPYGPDLGPDPVRLYTSTRPLTVLKSGRPGPARL